MKRKSPLTSLASVRKTSRRSLTLFAAGMISLMLVNGSYAGDTTVPWECSTYRDEAQRRCTQGLIEAQQDKIGNLEREVHSQQSQMDTFQEQLDRQSRAAADLQQQLDHHASTRNPLRIVFRWRSPSLWTRLGVSALGTSVVRTSRACTKVLSIGHASYDGFRLEPVLQRVTILSSSLFIQFIRL